MKARCNLQTSFDLFHPLLPWMIFYVLKIFVMKKKFPFFSILLISIFGYGQAYERAVQYQDKLQPAAVIDAYNLELTIKDQNDAVIKAEAKYKNLANEGEDLENKRTGIEKKIADNKNDQQ